MPTRRPKVPKAGSTVDSAGGAAASGTGGTKPVRRRNPPADPDTISATKPVAPSPAAESESAAAPAAKTPKAKAPAGTKASAATRATAGPKASTAAKASKAAKAPNGRKSGAATAGGATAGGATAGRAGTDETSAAAGRFRRRSAAQTFGATAGATAVDASDDLRPVPAKAFSGRLLVLAMVTLVITVLLAPSVNTYLHQRSDIAALEAEIAAQKETSRDLEAQLDRWEDPNYIKQQARERIFLVMPGETRYLVKGEHGVENAEQQAQEEAEDLQWVDALWDSVKRSATAP
ncbi:septum formation initiator family protein [Arthrobacter citreus]|uniref:FtsB family cell division protein n=1 Tax=Arthrobacter TaxID=1663 RepID=UPI001264BABE|nr:septum formation initiator family protein [Arthrobacter gandavensis]